MEEIYKPDPAETDNIDLHERGEHDLLSEIPNRLLHAGSYIVYGIIVLLIAGTSMFSYPDVVHARITIDDRSRVEWVTAVNTGELGQFIVENGDTVSTGDTICVMRNAASFTDIRRFSKVLARIEEYRSSNNVEYLDNFPLDLLMGDMAEAYEQLTDAVREIVLFHEFDPYSHKNDFLQQELDIQMNKQPRDEMLILQLKQSMFEMDTSHRMELSKNRRVLDIAYENMHNSLKRWDTNYLVRCYSDGVVVSGESRDRNQIINEGDTLCAVVAQHEGHPTGHIRLSQAEVAEVKEGDQVNIELSKYPSNVYGSITGEIASISFIPAHQSYAVEVSFSDGLAMSSRQRLQEELGLSGTAEIITSSRSVLSRIFAPLQKMFI